MMQDRIEINGVWYVREDAKESEVVDVIESRSMTVENDQYYFCFEQITNKKGEFGFSSIVIKDKWASKEETWDNEVYLKKLIEGLDSADDALDKDGLTLLTELFKQVKEKGWL